MARLRPPGWGLVLAAVLVVGFALRAHVAAEPGRYLAPDERAYARLGISLASDTAYDIPGTREPMRWAPGTPALFAAARVVGGGGRRLDASSQFWAQALVGTALIAATFWLGRLLAGRWAGIAAAAAVALYPPYAAITGDLVSEPLGALTFTLAMAALVLAWRAPPEPHRLAWAGFAIGLAALVRPDLLAIPLVVALALLVARRGTRAAAIYVGGAALALGPWILLASAREHQPVPVVTGGSSTLFVATYLPGDGTMFGMRHALAGAYRAATPRHRHKRDAQLRAEWLLDWVAETRHPGMTRDAALRAETARNLKVAAHRPLDFAAMSLRKLDRLWLGYDRGTHHPERVWVLRVHLVLLAAALCGLLTGLWLTRDTRLLLLLAIIAAATVLNAFFVAEARHNARLLPVLLAAGAAGWALAAAGTRPLRRRMTGRNGHGVAPAP